MAIEARLPFIIEEQLKIIEAYPEKVKMCCETMTNKPKNNTQENKKSRGIRNPIIMIPE